MSDFGLHSLKPAPGAKRDRTRIGRGHGSGHGKQPYAAWDASTDAFGELHTRNALTTDSESLAQANVLIAG